MPAAIILLFLSLTPAYAQYRPAAEKVPMFPREFRAAWIACVYNIDWPSKAGLSSTTQKQELRAILEKATNLKINALIFQVRPNADAVYHSKIEPWSPWISGTMGKSPGYDPLQFLIENAHARGIEVHAWFNPFRALPNHTMPSSRSHVTKRHPSWIRKFRSHAWMLPSHPAARNHSLQVMLDVVRRYDIDGLHIDDYFYPYPEVNPDGSQKIRFPDGLSNSQRRNHIDSFVKSMYQSVKQLKPHVRVGISPFGIWKPKVPKTIEASINPYEHLAADSRKWLINNWCDYLSPQLYWRIKPAKQSFSTLLTWWRQQGSRPVWPGIATARIKSKEDPERPASEIFNQINLTRKIGKNWVGHIHWSMNSLMQNKGGINQLLQRQSYSAPALVPPMPWITQVAPQQTKVSARKSGPNTIVKWTAVPTASRYAIQARYGNHWYPMHVSSAKAQSITLKGSPDAIAVSAVNRFGNSSPNSVLIR